ncbi:hypothetical protein B0A49_13297 [Cryomyces minteri]|uniref:Cupin type-2 domain-containing protein n=2 Tax=Cryomyces TaxID=329878 RepID=A0A4U0VZQ8_9PEZI|nr:hypothetical protein B0A49_13297 [Cryomyces minteri]
MFLTCRRIQSAIPSLFTFHHPEMLSTLTRLSSRRTTPAFANHSTTLPSALRTLTTTPVLRRKDPAMSSGPPKHEMKYFKDLTSSVRAFAEFRTVLHTGLYSQLVAMEVPVGGDIGDEVHTVDQVLIFTSGKGKATVAGKDQDIKASDVVVVPAGTQHQFVNTGDTPLELITVYAPAEHDPRTVHKTKEEGDKEEDEGKDEAPEWAHKSMKENEEAGLVKASGGPY